MEEKVGYIYILTNESFHKDNWVKIGYADNVERRVNELSNTSVPLPFKVYATYEIPKIEGSMPDKKLHDLIQTLNPSLRISSNREFFEITPWDAYDILKSMAIIHNRLDKLHRNQSNDYGHEAQDYTDVVDPSVEQLFPLNSNIRPLYDKLEKITHGIGPELVIKPNKFYVAFRLGDNKKRGNVVCLWPKGNCIEVVLNMKQGELKDTNNLTYDISNRLWTAAQYAFKFDETDDVDQIADLIKQSYDKNKQQ